MNNTPDIEDDNQDDEDLPLDAGSTAEESSTCPYCNGSGEGHYEGTRCQACRGWGVLNDA